MFNLKSYEKKIKYQADLVRRKNLHLANSVKFAGIPYFIFTNSRKKKEI